MTLPSIEIKNLNKRFGKLWALRNVNLTIKKGEYVVILGPTGAGKTTLLKIIAGLVKPTSGELYKNGEFLNPIPPEKRNLAYLPQTSDFSLFPYLDVWENTIFSPKMKGNKTIDEIRSLGDEILDMVNLRYRYNAFPYELSGGMKQRVALARAIAADADIFLFDEPLRALDARLRIRLRKEIKKLVSNLNKTTLHVTHDFEESVSIADKIMIINEGEIIQFGTPEEIYNHPNSLFSAYFFGETNLLAAKRIRKDDVLEYMQIDDHVVAVRKIQSNNGNVSRNAENDEVVIAIKADKINITPQTSNNENNDSYNYFNGIVANSYYLGKWVYLEITLEGISTDIKVAIPSSDLADYEKETNVRLSVLIDDMECFDEPWSSIKKLEAA